VFVRHFLTKLGRAVARRLGQEIPNRADAFVVFRYPPPLSAAAIAWLLNWFADGDATLLNWFRLRRRPRFRIPAICGTSCIADVIPNSCSFPSEDLAEFVHFFCVVHEHAGLRQPVVLFAHHLLLSVFGNQQPTWDSFGSFCL